MPRWPPAAHTAPPVPAGWYEGKGPHGTQQTIPWPVSGIFRNPVCFVVIRFLTPNTPNKCCCGVCVCVCVWVGGCARACVCEGAGPPARAVPAQVPPRVPILPRRRGAERGRAPPCRHTTHRQARGRQRPHSPPPTCHPPCHPKIEQGFNRLRAQVGTLCGAPGFR